MTPSPTIGLLATLKPLSGLNIVPLPMPIKKTISIFLSSSSPLMISSLLVQGISLFSTLLFGVFVKPFIPFATQSSSLIPLLDSAVESYTQGENQH